MALDAASSMYVMIGLSLGLGPRKTELSLPLGCDPESLPLLRAAFGCPLPDIVPSFKACLGVPRHPSNCDSFIKAALSPLAQRHDDLLDLVEVVSEEDPFAALRLLQVCAVNMCGHVLSAVPPENTATFCEERDVAVAVTLGVIHGTPVDPGQSTHTLPVVGGGVGLPSLPALAASSCLGAFFRVPCTLTNMLALISGTTATRAATLLADPIAVSGTYAWAASLLEAHSAALARQSSFTGS